MPPETLDTRVDRLERRVTTIEKLLGRIALKSQIVQLRAETREEFSAVRQEMREEFSAVRQEMREESSAVRREMHEGDEETRRLMRVLHEDVVSRIALVNEGRPSGRTRERRPPREDT